MRTILVPVAGHELMPSVMACALLVARRFGSLVQGIPLRAPATDYVPVDMVGGVTWARDEEAEERSVQEARSRFERAMRAEGLPSLPEALDGLCFQWKDDVAPGEGAVSSHARLFDLTVVARPVRGRASPSLASLEAVLFESGRPLLIAPPAPPESLGRQVVIAWNGSTETARAVAFAMPLLARAERVHVLSVEGGMVPGPSGLDLAASLRRHGLAVEASTVDPGRRSPGEAILEASDRLGCDLLVKGAYTQSRLRQMIFGGATSHLLAEADVPVLMAH